MNRVERRRLIGKLNSVLVETSYTKKALASLANIHDSGAGCHESRVLLLLGPPGAGKSMVLHHYTSQNPSVRQDEVDLVPVVYVQAPSPCSFKAVGGQILAAFGGQVGDRGTHAELIARILRYLRRHQTELLIIDEIQHLIDKDNAKIDHKAADFVKGLINANICPIVLAGQTEAESIVASNFQLRRRMAPMVYMRPLDWNNADERTEFRIVLRGLEAALELPAASDLHKMDSAIRIHHFSRGLPGVAHQLVLAAYEIVLDQNLSCISHPVLAEAVDGLRIGGERRLINPFREAITGPAEPADMYLDAQVRMEAAAERRRLATKVVND